MSDWRAAPTLVGGVVTLRPLTIDDRDALVAVASEDGLWNLFYANVSQLKDADTWFASVMAERDYGRMMPFAVIVDGKLVGTTRFMRMAPQHRRLEVGGTFYAPSVQRTGVNTQAKRLMLGHAFDTLRCQCVQFRTDALNLRSQAAIERLGAKKDGVLRGHQIVDGRLRDSIVYSILEREWPGVRANLDYLLEHRR